MGRNININAGASASQKKRILDWLLSGRSITPLEALRLFVSFRLGARIADIKSEGYDVVAEMVRDDRTGKRYAKYTLRANQCTG